GAPFTNNGTVNVQSGEMQSSGGITGSGSFVIAEGRKFRITSGTSTIGGNSISGSGTFEIQSATLNLSGSAVTVASGTTFLQTSGTIDGDGSLIINGTFNWVSSTQAGTGTTTITSTGTGIMTTANGKALSRTLVIEGLLEFQSSGPLSFSTGAQVINNGTIDFQANVSLGNINGTIVNNGTLLNSSATGGGILGAPFTNNGLIQINSGTISFSDTLKNNLTADIKGVGTLTTPTSNRFINNGTLSPGLSPGILRINGNYPQTSNASLNIEIGGYVVGSERDSLAVTQQAQLDGTLNIQFTNAFLPQIGDVFTIMSYGSRTGQFSQINLSNNVSAQAQYLANGLQIQITSGGSNLPPSAPELLSPEDNDTVSVSNPIAFLWRASTDPDNDPITYALRIFGSGVDTTIAGLNDTTLQFNGSGNLQPGNSFQWKVTASDGNLSAESATRNFYVSFPTNIEDEQIVNLLPTEYSLSQNYPNPLNPSTSIQYAISSMQFVQLKVYDILGNEVATLVNEEKQPGIYEVNFSASDLSSGMYLYRIQAGSFVETKKMILIK
ncbi:MAG TPA: T9SS type A sorting domain-containing protein, partial [Ignavibacteriaceae bacterium]|nr:T9SS type A sorting domain-containing protein [Ignavibacteriaceae bacterium]